MLPIFISRVAKKINCIKKTIYKLYKYIYNYISNGIFTKKILFYLRKIRNYSKCGVLTLSQGMEIESKIIHRF